MMAFDDDRDDKEVPEGALEEILDGAEDEEEDDAAEGVEQEEKGWE